MDKHLFFEQLHLLIQDEPNIIANLANISALLNQNFYENKIYYFIDIEKDVFCKA